MVKFRVIYYDKAAVKSVGAVFVKYGLAVKEDNGSAIVSCPKGELEVVLVDLNKIAQIQIDIIAGSND